MNQPLLPPTSTAAATHAHGLLSEPRLPHTGAVAAGCDDLDVPHRRQQPAHIQGQAPVGPRPLRLRVGVNRPAGSQITIDTISQAINQAAAVDQHRLPSI
jgi:hypothetical protein